MFYDLTTPLLIEGAASLGRDICPVIADEQLAAQLAAIAALVAQVAALWPDMEELCRLENTLLTGALDEPTRTELSQAAVGTREFDQNRNVLRAVETQLRAGYCSGSVESHAAVRRIRRAILTVAEAQHDAIERAQARVGGPDAASDSRKRSTT